MNEFELESDVKFFKADGHEASIFVGKVSTGYVMGYYFEGNSMSINYPLNRHDDDIFSTKEKAFNEAHHQLMRAIKTNNHEGRFNSILHCLGDEAVDNKSNEICEVGQLDLFSTY